MPEPPGPDGVRSLIRAWGWRWRRACGAEPGRGWRRRAEAAAGCGVKAQRSCGASGAVGQAEPCPNCAATARHPSASARMAGQVGAWLRCALARGAAARVPRLPPSRRNRAGSVIGPARPGPEIRHGSPPTAGGASDSELEPAPSAQPNAAGRIPPAGFGGLARDAGQGPAGWEWDQQEG